MTCLRQEALVSCWSLEAKAIRKAKLFHEIQELLSDSAKFDAESDYDQAVAACTGKYAGAQFGRDSSYPSSRSVARANPVCMHACMCECMCVYLAWACMSHSIPCAGPEDL